MAKGFKKGTGGANPLNFEVVGGNSQPTSASENTIWVNTSTAIHAWDFSFTEPKKRSKNKNLIVYPFDDATGTKNGITFTNNGNGTVTVNGTATAIAAFTLCEVYLKPGIYTLSGCPSGGNLNSGYSLCDVNTGYVDIGSGKTFTLTEPKKIGFKIRIASGAKVSNLVFRPQLEIGSMATSFVKGDATGQVWIKTGVDSTTEFNALKKNAIQVYPISTSQYTGAKWTDVGAKSYHGGEWIDIVIRKQYLIENGAINLTAHPCTAIDENGDSFTPTVKNGVSVDGYICLDIGLKNGADTTHTFAKVTIPAHATTMVIEYYKLGTYNKFSPSFTICNTKVTLTATGNILTNGTVSIDVTNVAGRTGDFSITQCGYSGCYSGYIKNAWFE